MKLIAVALVKFQSQLKPVEKGSENPFFKSTYANLSDILQAVMPLLSSCGLSITQPMRVTDNGTILITRLLHESGELIESEMILPHNSDPQRYGSLISYYKRYQLTALLGIATIDEDDDGNQASGKDVGHKPLPVKSPTPKPTFIVEPRTEQKPVQIKNPMDKASDAQKGALTKMGIYFSSDITKSEASALIENAIKTER
jgi:hypothetical protein